MVDTATTQLPTGQRSDPAQDAFFAVRDVRLSFGGLHVLQGVNLEVKRGEIVGLIGPNGAGKTTLFDVVSGFRPNARGHVYLNGVDLLTRSAWERPWLGLGRTFQSVSLYPNLTIFDCVRTALHRRQPNQPVRSLLSAVLGTSRSAAEERAITEKATEVVDRLHLGDYANKLASELSYGTLRMAELACILAVEPELVLLDEPSSGIAQKETEALGPLLLELREELGATFLLIEHDMPLIMGISDRIYALASGVVLAEGTPEEVQADPQVVESYLGGSFDVGDSHPPTTPPRDDTDVFAEDDTAVWSADGSSLGAHGAAGDGASGDGASGDGAGGPRTNGDGRRRRAPLRANREDGR